MILAFHTEYSVLNPYPRDETHPKYALHKYLLTPSPEIFNERSPKKDVCLPLEQVHLKSTPRTMLIRDLKDIIHTAKKQVILTCHVHLKRVAKASTCWSVLGEDRHPLYVHSRIGRTSYLNLELVHRWDSALPKGPAHCSQVGLTNMEIRLTTPFF